MHLSNFYLCALIILSMHRWQHFRHEPRSASCKHLDRDAKRPSKRTVIWRPRDRSTSTLLRSWPVYLTIYHYTFSDSNKKMKTVTQFLCILLVTSVLLVAIVFAQSVCWVQFDYNTITYWWSHRNKIRVDNSWWSWMWYVLIRRCLGMRYSSRDLE